MKLGIIITSYNDENTLEKAIQSLTSLKKKDKIYIALVDDCSTDSTVNIIKHAKKNNQIDVVHFNKKNLGVSSSRNIGINLCRDTDYITFLDSDDQILPNLSNVISKKRIHGDLIAFKFDYFFNNRQVKNNFYNEDKILEVNDIKKYFYRYLTMPNKYSLFTTCWAKLYRTELLVINKDLYFNEKLLLCEDTDFVFRFLTKSKNIQYINESIYVHTLGIAKENLKKLTFGTRFDPKHQISFLTTVESCKNYFIKNGHTHLDMQNRLDHCTDSYTIIYMIRSCMRINSLSSFISTYLFWKNIYNKNILSSKMLNYSYKRAGGHWLLPFLIKKKMFFIAILTAYYICNKRYL